MRIMVVGGGGREHALVWKLAQSPSVSEILCAPGNPGTAELAEAVPVKVNDVPGLVAAARERQVDLVVVGPEEPLSLGLADALAEAGIACFGPKLAAARIESSKAFAKEIMAAAGVPTARAAVVADMAAGLRALSDFSLPVVVKADGLAAGKGVVICATRDEAIGVLSAMLEDHALGQAGNRVVIEEFLEGREVSIFGITDGESVVTLVPSRDHKRANDGDTGPNTGGMGAFAPVPEVTDEVVERVRGEILEPVLRELRERGTSFQGVLYAGLMLTADGPKVLEFNCRLGDPETQVVLPLLDGDLAEIALAVAQGRLREIPAPRVRPGAAVGVVLASGGYPGPYQTGLPIAGLDAVPEDVLVFHAGTKRNEAGQIVTAGGRVLVVVGQGADLREARERAYAGVEGIHFDRRHYRKDIALEA